MTLFTTFTIDIGTLLCLLERNDSLHYSYHWYWYSALSAGMEWLSSLQLPFIYWYSALSAGMEWLSSLQLPFILVLCFVCWNGMTLFTTVTIHIGTLLCLLERNDSLHYSYHWYWYSALSAGKEWLSSLQLPFILVLCFVCWNGMTLFTTVTIHIGTLLCLLEWNDSLHYSYLWYWYSALSAGMEWLSSLQLPLILVLCFVCWNGMTLFTTVTIHIGTLLCLLEWNDSLHYSYHSYWYSALSAGMEWLSSLQLPFILVLCFVCWNGMTLFTTVTIHIGTLLCLLEWNDSLHYSYHWYWYSALSAGMAHKKGNHNTCEKLSKLTLQCHPGKKKNYNVEQNALTTSCNITSNTNRHNRCSYL